MERKHHGLFPVFIIIFYLFIYYFWILFWKNNPEILTLGGNILSVLGCLIPTICLYTAYKRSNKTLQPFWFLLCLGSLGTFLAESIWIYDENILKNKVPFPGLPDFFYILQVLFYLSAFLYKIAKEKRKIQFYRFLFDVALIMTVATTFSWYYLISPIFHLHMSTFSLIISLAYPIGDLILLFGALSMYFGIHNTFSSKQIIYIVLGLLTLIYADSAFVYLVSINKYSSGSLLDPLFILGILFVGFSGLDNGKTERIKSDIKKIDYIRLSFPYINVAILFIFITVTSSNIGTFNIGLTISILIIIIRQILIFLENRNLLHKFNKKTEELEISEQRYKSLFENHPDAVYSLDLTGKFQSVNSAGLDLLGREEKELIGLRHSSITTEANQKKMLEYLSQVKNGSAHHFEIPILKQNGDLRYLNITNIPILVKNKIVGIFGIGQDITENKKSEEKIKYLAYHDSLTSLPNRASFEENLNAAIEEAKKKNEMFAVMFLDLDRFKMINDTLGHAMGDQLLVSVSKRLQECIRENDRLARLSGDEFTILVRGISSIKDAEQIAQTILTAFTQPFYIDNHEIRNTVSIGIALFPSDGTSTETLMKHADIAMYSVKENGKGYFKQYSHTNQDLTRKFSLEKELRKALSRNEFFLVYQPQVDVKLGTIVGVEALLRWNNPNLGLISPVEFIPIAEETGVILQIGEWVLKEACTQAKTWSENGIRLKVGVNLSPRQLYQKDIVERITTILHETKVDPHYIDLEITEQDAMNNINDIIPKLTALKQLGVKISIDDFGTGYSSLSYLANFPIDTVKIAREFTNKIETDKANQTIMTSIINLAKKLNHHVIVEGVEKENQAAFLKEIDCDTIQGYLYGKPVSKQEIEKLLNQFEIGSY